MKTIPIRLYIVNLFILFLSSSLTNMPLYNAEGSIKIPQSESFGEICDLYPASDNEIVFITLKNNETYLYIFNILSNNIEYLVKLDFKYTYSYISDDNIYILGNISASNGVNTNSYICRYDLSKRNMSYINSIPYRINYKNQCAGDKNDNFYIINPDDSYNIIVMKNLQEIKSFRGKHSINNIFSGINGNSVYCNDDFGNCFFSFDLTSEKYFDFTTDTKFPRGKTKFLNDSLLLDEDGCVYSVNFNDFIIKCEFKIPRISDTYHICAGTNDILIYDNGFIYVIDALNGNFKGQIESCNQKIKLISLKDNYILFFKDIDGYYFNRIDISKINPVKKEIVKSDSGAFVFDPQSDRYVGVDLNNNYNWEIELNSQKLNIGNYDNIVVNITDINLQDKYTLTYKNGITIEDNCIKINPPNIPYNEQKSYFIEIDGIYNSKMYPCKIEHNIDLYYVFEDSLEFSISSDLYNIDFQKMIITGIEPYTTIATFKKNIKVKGYSYEILNSNGAVIKSGNIGTGKSINFSRDGVSKYKFIFIVYGDLTGSGNINKLDINKLINHLLGVENLDSHFLIAADVNHDGKVNNADLLCIKKHISGSYKISQR